MKQITIKEIAEKTGYSVNTVSRALSNRGEISKLTAEKIRDAAEKLGYFPNLLARGLAGKQTKTIGLIMGDTQNPFHWPIVEGIQKELTKNGQKLVLANSEETPEGLKNAIILLLSSQVDGLLMFFPDGGEDSLRLLHERNVPTVLMGTRSEVVPTSCVDIDDVLGGYLATLHLINRGCKRLSYIGGWNGTFPSEKRYEGYCRAIQETGDGNVCKTPLIFNALPSLKGGYDCASKIDFLGLKIDGILAHNDLLAMGIMHNLLERGIKVPEQVAVFGFDNIQFGEYCHPTLSTMSIPKEELGLQSVEMLQRHIACKLADEPIPYEELILKPVLVVRESA